MVGSGAAVGDDVGGGRVPAPGGAVRDPSLPGPVLFVTLYLGTDRFGNVQLDTRHALTS